MNVMHLLANQPWMDRLGWTLLHFLWQGAAIAAIYAGVRRAIRGAASNSRYLLACAALAALALAPAITWWILTPDDAPVVTARGVPAAARNGAGGTSLVLWMMASDPASTEPFLPWVVALWFSGATALWLRLIGGWALTMRLRSRFVRSATAEWQGAFDRLRERVRVSRPVRLLVSPLAETPSVMGWLRPVVVVPAAALTGMAVEQVEALLIHELAHVRRADYAVNLLQSAIEALLFYHPAVWWISGHIREEREACCDDIAVAVTGDVMTYATALAEVESWRAATLRTAMAANGGSLAGRIARLLGQPRTARMTLGPETAAGVAVLVLTAAALFGQADRPKFEVASIKPGEQRPSIYIRPQPGGRLTTSSPVRLLIVNAFSLQPFQVIGGPSWIGSDRFDIEAKGEGNATRDQLMVMLQSLLEDRFRFKYHRETREMPVFHLVTAKGGPKLPAPKEGGCVTPTHLDGPPPPPRPGQPGACGGVMIMLEPSGARMKGGKAPMSELVRILAIILGRPVIDQTGVTTLFDVQVDFAPDPATAGLPAIPAAAPIEPGGPVVTADPSKPSIFAALQEQLGLKLESGKGPVEVLVIDGIERPTGN